MALVKNQSLPAGDPLMFENPGDELYFGEVYRQILQEAWLPGGAEVWSVVGKSRRGRRPSQRGITGPNVTPSQTEVRRWFSKCAACWRVLPWEINDLYDCDNRHGKKYWKDEKDRRGLMCSYYDLYMRYCLRFALDTGCIPPANYLLTVDGDLNNISCNKVYDLSFPNKCGDVSMVSSEGEFIPPGEWLSPMVGSVGVLCFKDDNSSLGWIPYAFHPFITELLWHPDNATTIPATGQIDIFVLAGGPLLSWSVVGTQGQGGFSLSQSVTESRSNTLISNGACGTCLITITDSCGHEVSGYVRSTTGNWVHVESCVADQICGTCNHKSWFRHPYHFQAWWDCSQPGDPCRGAEDLCLANYLEDGGSWWGGGPNTFRLVWRSEWQC